MSDLKTLNGMAGLQDSRISAWAISLRMMHKRKQANRNKVDPRKSRGEHRDMRCDLVGIYLEVMAMMHLSEDPEATHVSVEYAQNGLLHDDIRKRPDGEPDFVLYDTWLEKTYADAKSYSVMRPYQSDSVKVNVQKLIKLKNYGCEHILFGFTRPFSTKSYFTGLVPIDMIGSKPWEYVSKPNSFNDYYSLAPSRFLKHGAELLTDLYNTTQYNIQEVERLAFESSEFNEFVSKKYPNIRW